MTRLPVARSVPGLLLLATLALAADDPPDRPRPGPPTGKAEDAPAERLSIDTPIACRSIDGFEDYEPLPEAALTADEKLLVYFRPAHYRVENSGGMYRIHLTQDGQIRRRSEKAVLLRKDKLLEYKFEVPGRPNPIYLRNTVSLKGLKPGEYDFDIILHDKFADGATATKTLPFKVVPAALPKADGDAPRTGEAPPTRAEPKARSKARPGRPRPAR